MPPWPQRRTSRRSLLASGAVLLLSACGVSLRPDGEHEGGAGFDGPLALVGGRLLADGELVPVTVILDGDMISAVDLEAGTPEGVRALDCTGCTLLPGFVDAHVHVQFADAAAILRGGVIAVRDLGSDPADRAAYDGTPLRVLHAGRILTPVGGYPTQSWGGRGESREVQPAEDDARAAVAEQLDSGAVVVKVALEDSGGRPLFDEATLRAIVDAAHEGGAAVTAHVGTAGALRLALDAGVGELAHLPLFDVSSADMELVADAGMVVCPTLAIRAPDPGAGRALAAFRSAGGRVVYGSDLGNGGTAPGIMIAEIRALLDAGMSPVDVVAAATSDAADYLGLPGGRIAEGLPADIIAVRGDPLADPDAYADLALVLAGGQSAHNDLDAFG